MSSLVLGEFGRCALLAGAGLSKNWGGFLASEFLGRLLGRSELADFGRVRALLISTGSFEVALEKVREADYSDEERRALRLAVQATYKEQDERLRYALREGRPVDESAFLRWLCAFKPIRPETAGFIFTLNQDLLLEMMVAYPFGADRPTRPAMGWVSRREMILGEEAQAPATVPREGWPSPEGKLNYVKLHGSVGWRSGAASDSGPFVIGGNKTRLIDASPLLAWYRDVFRTVCHSGGLRLVVIGYGFQDAHINQILLEGVRKHDLQMYLLDRVPPSALGSLVGDLAPALRGYEMTPLSEIMRPGEPAPPAYTAIERFLGRGQGTFKATTAADVLAAIPGDLRHQRHIEDGYGLSIAQYKYQYGDDLERIAARAKTEQELTAWMERSRQLVLNHSKESWTAQGPLSLNDVGHAIGTLTELQIAVVLPDDQLSRDHDHFEVVVERLFASAAIIRRRAQWWVGSSSVPLDKNSFWTEGSGWESGARRFLVDALPADSPWRKDWEDAGLVLDQKAKPRLGKAPWEGLVTDFRLNAKASLLAGIGLAIAKQRRPERFLEQVRRELKRHRDQGLRLLERFGEQRQRPTAVFPEIERVTSGEYYGWLFSADHVLAAAHVPPDAQGRWAALIGDSEMDRFDLLDRAVDVLERALR